MMKKNGGIEKVWNLVYKSIGGGMRKWGWKVRSVVGGWDIEEVGWVGVEMVGVESKWVVL